MSSNIQQHQIACPCLHHVHLHDAYRVFDIQKQAWFARDRATQQPVSQLNDGNKYLLMVKYLSTGWEVG